MLVVISESVLYKLFYNSFWVKAIDQIAFAESAKISKQP